VKHRKIAAAESLVHRHVNRPSRRVLSVGLALKTLEQVGLMRRHGFELIHAPDAATALRELHEKRPAIVCVDMTAPFNGHELARQIRNTAEGLGIVMVGLANKVPSALRSPAADANFDCFLQQPVDIDALIRIGDKLH
jgi:DNA-binding response OmpR family regulator